MNRDFFAQDTRVVARGLLGMRLVRVLADGSRVCGRIVETEAYHQNDTASHSFRGKTARTAPMFGPPGFAYVYFIYGMHFCFNVTTEPEGRGAAVLIRACEPLEGIEIMRRNRVTATTDQKILSGPANLCKAMQIDRAFSGYDTLQPDSVLFFAQDEAVPDQRVSVSPRIGIRGDAAALNALWRWYVKDSPSVSGKR